MANGKRRGITSNDLNNQNHQPRWQMNDMPIYTSKRTAKSLWQEYRIYRDRLELQCWIALHTLVIPANEILEIEVRPSVFSGRKGFIWGVKIDNCDLCRHVLLRRKSGIMKRIGFSPDDPEKFVAVCQSFMPGTT
jgi:hypothetical protein